MSPRNGGQRVREMAAGAGLRVPAGLATESYFTGLLASSLFGVVAGTMAFLTAVLFIRTSGVVANPSQYTVAGQVFFHPEHETIFFVAGCLLGLGVVLASTLVWNRRLRRKGPPAGRSSIPHAEVTVVVMCAGGALVAGVGAFFAGRHFVERSAPIPAVVLVAMLADVAFCIAAAVVGIPGRFSWSPGWLVGEAPGDGAPGEVPPRDPVPGDAAPTPVGHAAEPGEGSPASVARRAEPGEGSPASVARRAEPWGRRLHVLDVLVPAFLIAILYVPGWRLASGKVFLFEQFFHWDFFAMGATLAFSHGQALGAQVHSEYGMGWPVLFGLLKPILSVSYGHMIWVASMVTCAYFTGAYLLLRTVTRRASWAAAGALAAVLLAMFCGNFIYPATGVHATAWQLPSILVPRRPLDVWVFLAMALHLRTKRPVWAVLGGALTGLAVLFATDTGLYLAGAFALYWVCVATMRGRFRPAVFAGSVVAGCATLIAGLGIGSHWTLFSLAFWRAWWLPVTQGNQGYTALPIIGPISVWGTQLADHASLCVFVAVVVLYLILVCNLLVKVVHRQASPTDVLLGCISAYGLPDLISYLGRSDPVELPHLYVPMVVVLTILAADGHKRLVRGVSRVRPASVGLAAAGGTELPRGLRDGLGTAGGRRWPAGWRAGPIAVAVAPFVVVAALGAGLGLNLNFRQYPGVLQTLNSPSRRDGLCLMTQPRDICGLPRSVGPAIQEFQSVTDDMKRLSASGQVAMLDYQAEFNVVSGVAPWGPFVPLFDNLYTQAQAKAAVAQFLHDRPRYAFIRVIAQDPGYSMDVARQFRSVLVQDYTLMQTIGGFEVWQVRS